MNLSAQFKSYLLSQNNPASKATVKNYLSDVNRFTAWFEAKFDKEFSPAEVSLSLINNFKSEAKDKYSASSIERSSSSLRKFFTFLKLEGFISHSPFEASENKVRENESDPWKIRDFKNYLYVLNASPLTMKNYVIDVNQFKNWVQATLPQDEWSVINPSSVVSQIDSRLISDYKNRLLNELHLSPVSVNRKLSSLRRYTAWASQEGIIKPNIQVINEAKLTTPDALALAMLTAEQLPLRNQDKEYSKIPPVRLVQKSKSGLGLILDSAIVAPVAAALDKVDHAVWVAKGKPVFDTIQEQSGSFTSILEPMKKDYNPVKNVPKSFYAPTHISTANFPLHKKALHHARYTRPEWYRKYHSYAVVSYVHFSILMIIISLIGYMIFNNTHAEKQKQSVLASIPAAPNRHLAFQGRITDAQGAAINKNTNLRVSIYSSITASGSALLWQEVINTTPDKDGVFNIMLGKGTAIPSTLFSQNSSLWLGVTVGNTPELKPRQPIATVAYASNAETLQGLTPITATTATANVVLALNSSGNLTIGGKANPTFQATGGTFTLAGNLLMLTTNTGSNGNVALSPNGTGLIDIQKALVNTTTNGLPIPGAVTVNDVFVINGGSSQQGIFGINQTSSGDLITASTSGSTRFRVDNGGNIIANGSFNGLSISNGTVTSGTWNGSAISSTYGGTGLNTSSSTGVPYISSGTWSVDSNALSPGHGGTGLTSYLSGDLLYANGSNSITRLTIGDTGYCLVSNGSAPTWGSCSGIVSDGIWTELSGSIFPSNTTEDLLFGGQSTQSAKFAIININAIRGNQTASISGGITLDSLNAILQTTLNQNLSINPNGGFVGIGTSSARSALDVVYEGGNGGIYSTNYSDNTGGGVFVGYKARGTKLIPSAILANDTITGLYGRGYGTTGFSDIARVGIIFKASELWSDASQGAYITFEVNKNGTAARYQAAQLAQNGNFGIGSTAPTSSLYVTRPLSFGANGKALAIFDQIEDQDILTASSSGVTKFSVANNGTVSVTINDDNGYFVCKSATGTGLMTLGKCNGAAAQSDLTEMVVAPNTEEGDIVEVDSGLLQGKNYQLNKRQVYAKKTEEPYSKKMFGVISSWGIKFDTDRQTSPDDRAMTISGVMPIKVSLENGPIRKGDPITSSSTPGVGMKANKGGFIIARATEDFDGNQTGKILAILTPSWYDPDVYVMGSGELAIHPTANQNFEVKRNTGETISRIGAFSDLVAAKIKAGYLELGRLTVTTADIVFAKIGELTVNTARIAFAQVGELSTNSLAIATENITIAGTGIRDYIYSIVDQRVGQKQIALSAPIIEADIIKPQEKTLVIKLPTNDNTSKVTITNASNSAVATIDAEGNVHAEGDISASSASFSGKLAANEIETNDATISGTLRAGKIIAQDIEISEDLLAKIQGISIASSSSNVTNNYISNNYYYNSTDTASSSSYPNFFADTGTGSASLAGINADYTTFANGLMAFGPSSFFEASVADRLFVGSQLSIADRSINVLGADLEIQPLKQGGISFAGGQIKIDVDGNLKVGGNAIFAKNVEIGGKLSAGIIAPIPGKDLVFQFKDDSGQSQAVEFKTGTGSAVLSFNSKGDVKASGSGTFNKLNLSFIPKAIAVSDTEVIATGSAGNAEIKPYKNELTIKNPLITKDSLIYITPKTGTPNQSVYLLRQSPGESFTVGLSKAISKSVPFNWIIIN